MAQLKPVILFRNSQETEEEFQIAKSIWRKDVYENRTAIPEGSLVIGRFSVLPFYHELEKDLKFRKSQLINTYQQHQYVADLQNWYQDLEGYTPKTWFSLEYYLKCDHEGPVVLKGATNSKRELWKTHMYAKNKEEARQVYLRLSDDSLIRQQNIYIREYIPLKQYCKNVVGMPIVKEFRFFVYKSNIIASGFYWSNFEEESGNPSPNEVPKSYLDWIIKKIGNNNNFYSLDIAQCAGPDGDWVVIELNDGCMSGVNSIDPKILYTNLLSMER